MIEIGVLFGLLASVFKSSKSVTTKIASGMSNEYVTSFATRIFSIPTFLIVMLVTGSLATPDSSVFWYALGINSVSMIATTILLAKAFNVSDISIISPLLAFVPIAVTVPSYFIVNEVPSVMAGIGIVMVSAGAYLLNTTGQETDVLEPIRRLKSDRGARYILIVLVIVSVTPSFDKIGIQETSPMTWVICTHVLASVGILLFSFSISEETVEPLKSNIKILILVGISSSLIWVFQAYGYTLTQVSYVQAVKRTSLLFSVIAGGIIFDEDNIRRRLASSIVMVAGVVLIILGA